jgi:kinesin family protein 6/9
MPRGNAVKVCIRTRPTQQFAQDNIKIDEVHNTINIQLDNPEETPGLKNNRQNAFQFKFDHVFHNAAQKSVYDLYARDTVLGVADGINGAILSYGQTGSGKTFTMIGDTANYEHRGVAPRAINQLFAEVNARMELEYRVTCTYMEIYNEKIFDLLSDLGNPEQAADYTIIEEKESRGTFVRGLTEIEVKNENEALNLLFSGELTRTTATHKLNRRSNRSHSLFTIYLQQRQRSGISEKVVHSKLHLVDLAGSERLKKTMDAMEYIPGHEITKKESMSINQSLSYLEQCVIALARKSSHVPYRQSKLTNILKDCLGSNCNTVMLACIWGEAHHLEETISTLRLASRMMRVQNETMSVETVDGDALIKKQAKLIKALKQELLMHDALVERAGVNYDPFTPEQQNSIATMLEKYVDAKEIDEEEVLSINSYRQMLEICKQFKKMVLFARSEVKHVIGDPATGGEFLGSEAIAADKIAEEFDPNAPTVGSKVGSGFALGHASADSRPLGGVDGLSKYLQAKNSPGKGSAATSPERGGRNAGTFDAFNDTNNQTFGNTGATQGALFEAYIRGEGKDMHDQYVQSKSYIKELRARCKELASVMNDNKVKIDEYSKDIDIRKRNRIELLRKSGLKASETEDIVDEEEFRLMKELREVKRTYKDNFELLNTTKAALSSAQGQCDSFKNEVAQTFLLWSTGGNTAFEQQDDGDRLDDQEAFDKLEFERVTADDPDSLAFFNAQKTKRAHMTQHGGNIRQILKNKRV